MDAERVVSVNVGAVRPHPNAPSTSTGIIKAPSDRPLMLDVEGFEGDGQANRRVHGGPHMAAYVYSADDYAWWETELERPLSPGTFGENLTITGFRDADVRSGDRFQVAHAPFRVTRFEVLAECGIRWRDLAIARIGSV